MSTQIDFGIWKCFQEEENRQFIGPICYLTGLLRHEHKFLVISGLNAEKQNNFIRIFGDVVWCLRQKCSHQFVEQIGSKAVNSAN